ncbi:hypothetical protein BH20ACT2_BH20ACT2_17190 [soil metagenome]
MPWCDGCSRFYNPNSVAAVGECPDCGRPLTPARPVATAEHGGKADGEPGAAKAPWHFWLLVVAVVAYLGWRALQGVAWLVGRI